MVIALRHIFLSLLLVMYSFSTVSAEKTLIRPGDQLPEMRLFTPTAVADREYLRLPDNKTFTPSQIKADVLLVELINVHCPHCRMQVPAYNELFDMIEANPETQGKIKMLGLAVGNLDWEVEDFREYFRIDFPILADSNFTAWRAIGGRATPLTIYVRQTQSGQPGIVTGIHQGLNSKYQHIYQHLIQIAATSPAEHLQMVRPTDKQQASIPPILSDVELEFEVRTAFTRLGTIESFSELFMRSERKVYTAQLLQGQVSERFFAEVTSRPSVCDICHDVHFIYLFDSSARVVGFKPLQLTKWGNVNWDENDVKTMRKNIVGKYLTMPQPFDPKLDAITSATITSAIIFDSLAQGNELIQELRAQGLM